MAKGEIVHQTIECKFCEKHYLRPCSTIKAADECPNYQFKMRRLKPIATTAPVRPIATKPERVKPAPKTERVKLKPKAKENGKRRPDDRRRPTRRVRRVRPRRG